MKFSTVFAISAAAAPSVFGAIALDTRSQDVWAQCGGIGFAGDSACAAGSACVRINDYYSQCQPQSQSSTAVPAPAPSPVTSAKATVQTTSQTSAPISLANYSPASGMYPLYASKSAIATTYGGNWPGGTCSFSDYPHAGINGVALGKQQWFGAAGCGACVKITGASGSVVAMVNDQCPECVDNHLDLDLSYAAQVDKNYATKGIFDITWQFIPCPISGNIQFKNKDGTSAYYFAMQVRNSVLPIDTLEVSTNNGATWTKVERFEYNYFTHYGGFGNVVDVRITATTGAQIVQKGVTVSSGSIVTGSSQFKV